MGTARRLASRRGLRTLLIALLAAIATGCASHSGPPRWLEHPGRAWPAERYVTGVGQGGDPEAAAAAARGEIARQTKGESEGIEIARTFVAKKPKVHWALAVLDRPALITQLAERITSIDQQLATEGESTKEAPPEKAIVVLLAAIAQTKQREVLRSRIARLGGTPPPAEATPSRAALDEQLTAVKRALTIDVAAYEMEPETGAIGSPLDAVRRALAKQVLAKGFSLPVEGEWGDTSAAWLLVRARIGFEPLELGGSQGFSAVQWEAALEIEDRAAGGQVIALLSDEARATHINLRSSRRLAREEAMAFLADALADWLDEHYAPSASLPRP